MTYRYECPGCGEFEVEQRLIDAPLQACPSCSKVVKKLIPTSIGLKSFSMANAEEFALVKHYQNKENAFHRRDGRE